MNKSIIPVTPGLLALLSRVETGIKPFVHEIFLLEIVVAGTTHCSEIDQVEEFIVPEEVSEQWSIVNVLSIFMSFHQDA